MWNDPTETAAGTTRVRRGFWERLRSSLGSACF
jgi:hypothetical protein